MTRRSRAPRFLWLAASRPIALPLRDYFPTADNDNARPALALSLAIDRWLEQRRGAK